MSNYALRARFKMSTAGSLGRHTSLERTTICRTWRGWHGNGGIACEKELPRAHSVRVDSILTFWQVWQSRVGNDIQPHYKMSDWDKVFGNPKSSFIINVIILNTKMWYIENGYWNISPFFILLSQAISICTLLYFYIAINLTHSLMIIWLPMVEIQYDDTYVRIDAIKIISLNIKKKVWQSRPI